MSYAIEANTVLAGFINSNQNGTNFTINDIYNYITELWNAGIGPIRLNFTEHQLKSVLENNSWIIKNGYSYTIKKKDIIEKELTERERRLLKYNKKLYQSYMILCDLQFDIGVPSRLLDFMNFNFLIKE